LILFHSINEKSSKKSEKTSEDRKFDSSNPISLIILMIVLHFIAFSKLIFGDLNYEKRCYFDLFSNFSSPPQEKFAEVYRNDLKVSRLLTFHVCCSWWHQGPSPSPISTSIQINQKAWNPFVKVIFYDSF